MREYFNMFLGYILRDEGDLVFRKNGKIFLSDLGHKIR